MVTRHKNSEMQRLIAELKQASRENNAPVWGAVAEDLERPARNQAIVNLARLNRFTSQGDVIVVPGKLLGDGELSHSITIAALGFSASAQAKLKLSKATIFSITELIKKDPKGKTVKVFA